jgi:hypothetical protein
MAPAEAAVPRSGLTFSPGLGRRVPDPGTVAFVAYLGVQLFAAKPPTIAAPSRRPP